MCKRTECDASIIRAIVALSKELNLRVVAEGVETWKQFELLQELGCDMAQGYLLARPMELSKVLSWLATSLQSNRIILDQQNVSSAA